MSAIETTTDMRERAAAVPPLRHIYPRSSNVDAFAIGAVAFCGHRRVAPWGGRYFDGSVSREHCLVCVDMCSAVRGRRS